MNKITEPLRLATGSHEAGSGKGCVMNVVSWINGEQITDMPDCADPLLAQICQRVNDSICSHRDETDLLCPECSILVLELGARTIGTSGHGLDEIGLRRVWVRVAADQARQVAHLNPDPRVMAAIEAAERWANNPTAKAANAAAYAAAAAAYAAAAIAATKAANAAGDGLGLAHRAIDVFLQHAPCPTNTPTIDTLTAAHKALVRNAREAT